MRLSEFWDNLDEEFGRARSRTLARDHVLAAVGYRTAEQALAGGVSPREVWLAVCTDLEVPPARWGSSPMSGTSRPGGGRR